MTRAPQVPDAVWAQLDPRAGRLSRPGRRGVLAVVVSAVAALGLAVLAAVTGAIEPRVDGLVDEGRFDPARHTLVLHVEIDNAGSAALDVDALTTETTLYEITATPAPFEVPGHGSRVVRIALRVRSCADVTTADAVPIAIVVGHWWGHRTHALLAADDSTGAGLAAMACHLGPS